MATTIILADDHKLMREGLKYLLEKQSDMDVVAEADNGRQALELTLEHQPDLVIMDVNMPELDGIEAAREILHKLPEIKILCLSMYSNRRFIEDMLKVGASGYLLKECAFKELIDAIHTVCRGETYLSPKIAGIFVERYVGQGSAKSSDNVLSEREREVLRLLAEGKSTKEIALNIHMSGKTVDACRRQMMNKLNVHSVAELVKYAIREGFTSLEV